MKIGNIPAIVGLLISSIYVLGGVFRWLSKDRPRSIPKFALQPNRQRYLSEMGQTIRTLLQLFCLVWVLAMSIGCKASGSGPQKPIDSTIASVAVLPSDEPLISVGQKVQLEAVTSNSAGVEVPGTPTSWATSDSSILAVSSTGLMTGVDSGTATISATAGGKSTALDFRVVDLTGTWVGGEAPDTVSYTLMQSGTSVMGVFQSRLGFPPITNVNSGTLTGSLDFGLYSHILELTIEDGCVLQITGTHRAQVQTGGELILAPGPAGNLSSTNCSFFGTIDFVTLRRQ